MERKIEVTVAGGLPGGETLPLPVYATPGSAGLDLRASVAQDVTISPGDRHLFSTGLSVNMVGSGMVAIVASRSGLSLKHGLRVAQGVGVIDSDYRGEIGVILANDGSEPYTVHPGDRIAQLLFLPVFQVELQRVEAFGTESERGTGGFGHTGQR